MEVHSLSLAELVVCSYRMPIDFSWNCFYMKWSNNNYYQGCGPSWKCIQPSLLGNLQTTWKWMSQLWGNSWGFYYTRGAHFDLCIKWTKWFWLISAIIDRTILMTYKHKTHAINSDGKVISNADLDFYIDDVCLFILLVMLWLDLSYIFFSWSV